MKRAIGLTTLFLGILSVIGCGKEEPVTVVPEATLSATSLVFDRAESQKTVYVKLQGDGLAVSSVQSSETWCGVEPDGDEAIVVSVTENETESVRRAVVTLTFSDAAVEDKTITVAQESGSAKVLETTAVEGYVFDCRGGEYKFSVEASSGWTAELVECDWATIAYDAATVTVTAPANEGNATLTGKVKVTSGDASLEYSFTQATVADNKYLSLLGKYDIYAETWYYVSYISSSTMQGTCYSAGKSGTLREVFPEKPASKSYTSEVELVEDKYGFSYKLKDFLVEGQDVPVNFDAKTGSLEIPTLWNVGQVLIPYSAKDPAEYMPCFFVGYRVDGNNLRLVSSTTASLPCVVSEDGNTISISTTPLSPETAEGETPIVYGICLSYMHMGLSSPVLTPFQGLYMPYGSTIELRRVIADENNEAEGE